MPTTAYDLTPNLVVHPHTQLPLIVAGIGALGGLYYAKEAGHLDQFLGVPSTPVRNTSRQCCCT